MITNEIDRAIIDTAQHNAQIAANYGQSEVAYEILKVTLAKMIHESNYEGRIKKLAEEQGRVPAITQVRKDKGWGLREAKELVDDALYGGPAPI